MTAVLIILAAIIVVPVALLVWLGIGAKQAMNRNDNRKEPPNGQ